MQQSPSALRRAKQEFRRLKVLLSKRFARFKYDYREDRCGSSIDFPPQPTPYLSQIAP